MHSRRFVDEQQYKLSRKRNRSCKITRGIVAGVHFFYLTDFYKAPFTGINMFFQGMLRWLFFSCVPLFLLVTGYLMCNKELSIKHYKKLLSILEIYVFYCVLAMIIPDVFVNKVQPPGKWILYITTFQDYSWYVEMYIGLFILIPFLNLIFNNITKKKNHQFLIAVLLLMIGIPAFVNNLPALGREKYFFLPDWWNAIYPVVYYFIGAYIRKYQPRVRPVVLISLICAVVVFEDLLSLYFSKGGIFVAAVGDYDSIVVILQATLIFLLVYKLNIKRRLAKAASSISEVSLEILLGCIITDKMIYGIIKFVIKYTSQQEALKYLAISIPLTLFLSLGIAFTHKLIKRMVIKIFRKICTCVILASTPALFSNFYYNIILKYKRLAHRSDMNINTLSSKPGSPS